jgi:hypothetical protein
MLEVEAQPIIGVGKQTDDTGPLPVGNGAVCAFHVAPPSVVCWMKGLMDEF